MYIRTALSLALISSATNTVACGFSLTKPLMINQKNIASLDVGTNFVKNKPFQASKRYSHFDDMNIITRCRGGALKSTKDSNINASSTKPSLGDTLASLWAAGGVVMILAKSIKRILPIALEPFGKSVPVPLSNFQLGAYVTMCLWFAYVEGYKGFQLKFSPLVVARAQTIKPFNGSPIHHTLLAPFYAMGLFHATRKRKIVSWSVTTGVAVIVAAVKRLPYPWRNIVDAGVIVGLSWGSISIMVEWVKAALLGKDITTDPALPDGKSK